ncbi:hypothetical protein BGZ60DRAFT_413215 [Tricladium varicosporioides]|nr:hypothetical protein BGZ60DRAFT_413215 [Hymenoscyphus varicosporioides]
METSILQRIPLEIRIHIYNHVLESPTGAILLSRGTFPPTPPERRQRQYAKRKARPTFVVRPIVTTTHELHRVLRIELGLFRTCKQIHNESKHILWRRNILRLHSVTFLDFINWNPAVGSVSQNLRHVEIDVGCGRIGVPDLRNTRIALQKIAEWSRNGSVKSLAIIFAHTRDQIYSTFFYMCRVASATRQCFDQLLGTLKWFKKACSPQLSRQIRIDRISGRDSNRNRWLLRNRHLNMKVVASSLHEHFGGELWADGILCYKNGVEICDRFLPTI